MKKSLSDMTSKKEAPKKSFGAFKEVEGGQGRQECQGRGGGQPAQV